MVYATLLIKNKSRSNIPACGIFDLSNKKLFQVNIPVYGIFDRGNKKIIEDRLVYGFRPGCKNIYCGRIYWYLVYSSPR